jgi:tetraacyldisaccharide 4'-kinase
LGESEININDLNGSKVLLVTGIANDKEIVNYLRNKNIQFDKVSFSDHYKYSLKDIQKIELDFSDRIIITTEKDYQKIKLIDKKNKWYYLQMETYFLNNEDLFKKIIIDTIIK